jgi:uncharacterized oxidoreductase
MKTTGNTILITGGATGIGRGLAEAFHARDNQVVIAGRRQAALDEVTRANPGMRSLVLDIAARDEIAVFAARVAAQFPALNVLINNAGMMQTEDLAAAPAYLDTAEATIATNLLGPVRLTAHLLPHLKARPNAAVLAVSSGLAFVPLAASPTYCTTKAAIHSYWLSLRHQLKGDGVEVIEIAPPYVQTELNGPQQATDPNAMPLSDYIAETMRILSDEPGVHEVLVERVRGLRFAEREGRFDQTFAAINGQRH